VTLRSAQEHRTRQTRDAGVAPDRGDAVAAIIAGRKARYRRHAIASIMLGVMLVILFLGALMFGNTFYGPDEVFRVIAGQTVPGASFTVGELRLPRAVLAVLAGFAFGIAGVSFQTLLRNPLASPDIIGISDGAGAAAVIGIVVLSLNGPVVSVLALLGALTTAAIIYLLSNKGGFAGTRLILIGIGVAAMLQSVISYVLSRAANWDIQTAMQWLTGSLNNASWERVIPLAIAAGAVVPVMLLQGRGLGAMQLGDDSASGLGVRVNVTRILFILGAVVLLAFATAATGPIAFVAFMAGPIAARITGPGANLLLPSAFVGAVLVLGGDLIGQFAFGERYPVGVITGVLGAPYLIYLLIRTNRSGGSL
jgi:iron complex transport system permease protein